MPNFRTLVTSLLAAVLLAAIPASAHANQIERVTTGPLGGNGAFQNDQGRLSEDGSCAVFETNEKLVAEDPNNRKDIYERCGSTTILVSTGPAPNADATSNLYMQVEDIDSNGGCVLFFTADALTNDDGDTRADLYKRCGTSIERVSQGPNGGNGGPPGTTTVEDVTNGSISRDGLCVAFLAHEQLTSDDHDGIPDIFERCGSTTKRISQGPAGGDDPSGYPTIENITPDGSCVMFTTGEKLTSDDTDSQSDVYVRCGTTTTKASAGNGDFPAYADAVSPDGSCVDFETDEPLASTDTDTQTDLYSNCDGTLRHVSAGPTGGGGDFYVSANEVSADARCVVFTTDEALTADDTDTVTDVYKRCGDSIDRVSTGPDGGNAPIDAEEGYASADGRCVLFTTAEHITPDDTDATDDAFVRCGDSTEHVSVGPKGGNANIAPDVRLLSANGTRTVFMTSEQLTEDDTNDKTDVYEHSGGQTTLVSPALKDDNVYGSNAQDVSLDANRILFSRYDRLTDDDTDDSFDLYLATIAPTAEATDATDVTQTSATLNGRSSGGTYHFEYGTDTTYGSATPDTLAGSTSPSAAVSGLTAGTTYHYRLVATGPGGTTQSADHTFTTAPATQQPPPGSGDGNGNGGNDGGNNGGTGGTGDQGNGGDQGQTPPPDNGSGSFAGVTIKGHGEKIKRGIVTIRVACPADAQGACAGTLTLKAGKKKLGTKRFTAKPGRTANVRFRIPRKLRNARTLKATATAHDARNVAVKTTALLKLKR